MNILQFFTKSNDIKENYDDTNFASVMNEIKSKMLNRQRSVSDQIDKAFEKSEE